MARLLLARLYMPHKAAGRVRLSPEINAKAHKLADLVGLDVDSFVGIVIVALYEQALELGELGEDDQETAS